MTVRYSEDSIFIINKLQKQKMDRNSAIFDKVQEINDNFNHKYNRVTGADSMESKLIAAKKKMDLTIAKSKQELQMLIVNAGSLFKKIEAANAEYDHQSNLQIERIKEISDSVSERLQIEILARKEKENAIITAFEQKAQNLKQEKNQIRKEIEKERKIREQLFSQVAGTLEEDLPTIMNQILENKEDFEEQAEKIDAAADELFEESQKYLKEFSQEQKENSNKAFSLIKDLTKKIKNEFDQQKMACEATHEEVINYVEETCNKISVESSF